MRRMSLNVIPSGGLAYIFGAVSLCVGSYVQLPLKGV